MAGIDPMELDLSEFLEEDEQPKPTTLPAVDAMTQAIRQELGLEEFGLELPTNGVATDPSDDVFAGLAAAAEQQPPLPDLKPVVGNIIEIQREPNLEPRIPEPHRHEWSAAGSADGLSYAPSSTGFGIFEQILLELTRLNLEIAGLRHQLSNPGSTLGPSVQSLRGPQRTASVTTTTAEGAAGVAPRPRRGRPPKKEVTSNDSGELVLME